MRKLILLSIFMIACTGKAGVEPNGRILVGAASSTAPLMRDLGKQFEALNPGKEVEFTFAASGVLLRQLEEGAKIDAVVFADKATISEAKNRGIEIEMSGLIFRNKLILATPTSPGSKVGGFEELAESPTGKIAVGNPALVPLGRYAKAALLKLEKWDALESKVIIANSAAQVREYLSLSEVDAAVIYGSDLFLLKEKAKIAEDLTHLATPEYYAGAVSGSDEMTTVLLWNMHLTSKEAAGTISSYGFIAKGGSK